jgi:hypothetical protein
VSTDVWDEVAAALEAGYDDEPAPRTAAAYVATGRRRQRNRRLRYGAAGALVAAVAVTVAVLPDGSGPRSTPDPTPVVQEPSPTPVVTATPEPTQKLSDVLVRGQHAGYDAQGAVVLRRGWRIVREVPNPLHRVAPDASVGLVVTNGEETYWYLLDHTADGGGASWDPARVAHARFEQWLTDMVDLQSGTEPAAYVTFAADGTLEPGVGVRILGQWPDPDVPGFARPGEDSAVAKVLLDGRVSFVLARRSPGGPTDAIPVDVDVLPEPTLAAFLAYARDRYASGAGLR